MTTIADVLLFLIEKRSGRTARELAQAIFGEKGRQERVNGDCNLLLNRGLVERSGKGGQSDPYRYYPASR